MTLPPSSDFRWHFPVRAGCFYLWGIPPAGRLCDAIMNQVCALGQRLDRETCGAGAEASARGPDRGAAENAGPSSHLPDSASHAGFNSFFWSGAWLRSPVTPSQPAVDRERPRPPGDNPERHRGPGDVDRPPIGHGQLHDERHEQQPKCGDACAETQHEENRETDFAATGKGTPSPPETDSDRAPPAGAT